MSLCSLLIFILLYSFYVFNISRTILMCHLWSPQVFCIKARFVYFSDIGQNWPEIMQGDSRREFVFFFRKNLFHKSSSEASDRVWKTEKFDKWVEIGVNFVIFTGRWTLGLNYLYTIYRLWILRERISFEFLFLLWESKSNPPLLRKNEFSLKDEHWTFTPTTTVGTNAIFGYRVSHKTTVQMSPSTVTLNRNSCTRGRQSVRHLLTALCRHSRTFLNNSNKSTHLILIEVHSQIGQVHKTPQVSQFNR